MFVACPTPEAIAGAAREMRLQPGTLLAVLVADDGAPDLGDLVAALRDVDTQFFGGLFPGLIHGDRQLKSGALLVPLPADSEPVLVRGLDRPNVVLPDLGHIAASPVGSHTAVVLVDGLTANVSRLLAELHRRLGNSVHYIGGGAGSLSLEQGPCVFSREGVFQDAAVVSFVRQRSRLGVRHGWKQHEGPVVATRTSGNVIHELNWRTAFDVYREAVEPFTDVELTRDNFFTVSTAFPFGIYKEGEEDVVRDPVAVGDSGELTCVGEVPENAVLNILRGDRSSLVEAAGQAADDCCAGGPLEASTAFVVDCVSRTIFLDDDFECELTAVRERVAHIDPRCPVQGILSLGEISSHGQGYVEFFNKTIVAAVLYD